MSIASKYSSPILFYTYTSAETTQQNVKYFN